MSDIQSNQDQHHSPHILIVTAVEAERDAVLRGLNGDQRFEVIAAGVGVAAAAAGTTAALIRGKYSLVISAGIAGGFADKAAIGSIVVASDIVAADLGAETAEGFASVEELGFGSNRISAIAEWSRRLADRIQNAGLPVHYGPILTVTTATGRAESAAALATRVPGAAAEAMEGYGAAVAAASNGVAVAELRAISNVVGPRDRAAWRIGEALEALTAACTVLKEVIDDEDSLFSVSE